MYIHVFIYAGKSYDIQLPSQPLSLTHTMQRYLTPS